MEQTNISIESKSGVEPPRSKFAAGLLALWLIVAGILTFSRLTHEAFGVQGDLTLHYHITRSYAQSFSEGDPLPRWAGLLDGGRGDALFTFYPPLCYFTSALLMKLFGLDVLNSIKALTFLILLLAQASAYLFAREFFSRRLSLLVSLAFVLLPAFPLIGLHRAFLANAFALSFMPLALKHAYRLIEPGRHHSRNSIIAFALSFSLIILSHAITTYLTGLAIGFLALAYLPRAGWRSLLQLAKAVALALLLTAFFLLPQIVEADWVQLKLQLTQQDYRNYFLFAKAATTERYRQAWAGVNDFASYMTITQTLTGMLLALLCWPVWRRDRLSPLVWFGVTLTAFGFLIALPASDLLWRYLPGLKFIQFPWRFQPFVALGCALLAAVAITVGRVSTATGRERDSAEPLPTGRGTDSAELPPLQRKLRSLLIAGVTWPLIASVVFTFMIARLEEKEVTRSQVVTGLTAYDAPPLTIGEGKEMQNGNDMKYLPYSANQLYFRPVGADFMLHAPARKPGEATIAKGAGQVTTETLEIARRRFQVESVQPTQVRINTYNHPNWHALLNGANTAIQSEPETGLMLIGVPGGQHRITLTFDPRHSTARAARLVSITAWVLLALTLGFQLIRRK